MDHPGVYYILSGRADFLWDVGLNSEVGRLKATRSKSPGIYQRIHLNPIRTEHIDTILRCTIPSRRGCSIATALRETRPDLTEVTNALYEITGGHPRSLMVSLSQVDPLQHLPDTETVILLADVKRAVQLYPTTIRNLMDNRHTHIDLTEIVKLPGIKSVSREYFASRIHCGIGSDLKRSMLTIMPPILHYLETFFQPFVSHLLRVESMISGADDDGHSDWFGGFEKSRMFEELLLKWFISVSRNPQSTWADKVGEFCPSNSSIARTLWHLEESKLVRGLQVLKESTEPQQETTISLAKLGIELQGYLITKEAHIYFPAPKSASPDFIIIPPVADKIVIGVQAKCYGFDKKPINRNAVIHEAMKFYRILQQMQYGYKAVFIMCVTGTYTKRDFPEIHNGQESMIWDAHGETFSDMEILIVNLTTAQLRSRFFSKAIFEYPTGQPGSKVSAEDARTRVASIIETLIQL